ncbi:MAG: hypothetical protein WDM84_01920 [Bauldia sp.]
MFFDIDAIADTANPLPHMLPTPEAFAAAGRSARHRRAAADRRLRQPRPVVRAAGCGGRSR